MLQSKLPLILLGFDEIDQHKPVHIHDEEKC